MERLLDAEIDHHLGYEKQARKRGSNVLICADGLSGLDKAVEAAFPKTVLQTCVVHVLRFSSLPNSWRIARTSGARAVSQR